MSTQSDPDDGTDSRTDGDADANSRSSVSRDPQEDRDYPRPPAEQTPLQDSIEISLVNNPRMETSRRRDLADRIEETATEADASRPFRGASIRVFERKKSCLSIQTLEEAEDLLKHVNTFTTVDGIEPWMSPVHIRLCTRLKSELEERLERKGIQCEFYKSGDVDLIAGEEPGFDDSPSAKQGYSWIAELE